MKKRQICLLIIEIILFGAGYLWLNAHPEYVIIDLSRVVVFGNETLYTNYSCPYTFTKEHCTLNYIAVPPAYYIYQYYVKIQPYLFWVGLIGIVALLYIYRKEVSAILQKIQ